jgi:phosphotransferase system enzyme I (PtsI)
MKILKGTSSTEGISIGRALIFEPMSFVLTPSFFEKGLETHYLEKWEEAKRFALGEITEMIERLKTEDESKSKIFEAHQEIILDEELNESVKEHILDEYEMPDYAVFQTYNMFIGLLKDASDPLIAARTADLCDVRNRLLRIFQGKKEKSLSDLPDNAIIVAHEFLPSDTATLDRKHTAGIISEVGGMTSHTAIIAKSYNIPAIMGIHNATGVIEDGDLLIMDAFSAEVTMSPDAIVIKEYKAKKSDWERHFDETEKYIDANSICPDGSRIEIGINIGGSKAEYSCAHCDFVGLLRSEFLYMNRDHLPTEEEQFQVYKEILGKVNGKPVTLRTLDIGGDKTLKYMQLPCEDNPFLGKRAVRLCFERDDIFRTQLRAALRASAYGNLWIMFPMVGSLDDFRRAKVITEQVKSVLLSEGIRFCEATPIGAMIEIPAAALVADLLAKEVDFASIGTNDLCQYVCAADRMNPDVSAYNQPLSPAMIRLLHFIITSFQQEGKPLSVCGELAGQPMAALLLAGMGLRKFSMSERSIAGVKRMLCTGDIEKAAFAIEKLENLSTERDVVSAFKELMNG